jgi:hypothetical protein
MGSFLVHAATLATEGCWTCVGSSDGSGTSTVLEYFIEKTDPLLAGSHFFSEIYAFLISMEPDI